MTANPNKALWEKGDFTRLAATMRESGDALVRDREHPKSQRRDYNGEGDADEKKAQNDGQASPHPRKEGVQHDRERKTGK